MSHSKKQELIEELSSESINVLRVKILCRETPGLIASAGLRTKIWSLLLLGSTQTVHKLMDNSSGANIDVPSEMCRQGQVLDADVHRTRADVEEFRSTAWRQSVRAILLKFCIEHCVQYKQGMNEILAPFLYLLPPPRHGSLLPYALFEAFIFRYLERFVCVDDSAHLFKAFRCFHLLLLYFDAQLANHLLEQDFPPELYSPQWFLTLYSRSMPLPYVLRLWDMMIAVDDPSFAFFVGLCLLCRKRTDLLLADREGIPEIMVALQFQGEEEIDGIVAKAQEVYRATPKCFLRYLRLCCVSTTELMPLPILHSLSVFNGVATGETTTGGGHSRTHTTTGSSINSSSTSTATSYSLNVNEFDKSLALQAARQCIMLSPQDLVNNLLNPSNVDSNSSTGSSSRTDNAAASAVVANTAGAVVDKVCLLSESTTSEFILPQQYVMIDVRSAKDVAASGGGILPRAIQLDPDLFLTRPEALDIWIQHFDGTRGCPIVLIDLPAARWTGLALWRRLLLGEGDEASSSSSSAGHATQHHQHQQQQRRDEESRYAKEEADVVKADTSRPAVQLARALQAHSFPHVSLLQGGFPALLAELKTRNAGCVEPFVINHESEKWESFLRSTGREYDTSSSSTSSSSSSSSGRASGGVSVLGGGNSATGVKKRRNSSNKAATGGGGGGTGVNIASKAAAGKGAGASARRASNANASETTPTPPTANSNNNARMGIATSDDGATGDVRGAGAGAGVAFAAVDVSASGFGSPDVTSMTQGGGNGCGSTSAHASRLMGQRFDAVLNEAVVTAASAAASTADTAAAAAATTTVPLNEELSLLPDFGTDFSFL
mmetsp:Transcript_32702/g.55135  ORF Transcript_32702/g.55135 Transcript_32702/m.55135 type:complete len:833 (-) Transcript_32702:84-2582(-)